MARRLALVLVLALCLVPTAWRALAARPAPPADCAPEGRGVPPRHWMGCAADPGAPRPLDGHERLAAGLPLDPNTATAEELGEVPGLSPRLGAAIVAERARGGPFEGPDDLLRVPGLGPARLRRARPHLAHGP